MGTLFTALGAAAALAGTDIIPVHQGGARAVGLTGAQLLTYVGATHLAKAGGTMTGALTLPAGSAAAPSLLFTGAGSNTGLFATGPTGLSIASSGVSVVTFNNSTTRFRDSTSSDAILLEANTAFIGLGTSNDVRFGRDAAATLAQRNGTTQQIFRLYNTYTDSSNYERLTLTGVAGTSVNIKAETLGTGGDNLDIVLTPAGTGNVRTAAPLTIASGTLTASAPALNITQTWNGSGVSFRAIDISITNTLSALSYPIVVSVGGSNVFYLSSAGDLYANNFRTTSNGGSLGIGSTADVLLYRDAAAQLALRNGATAQRMHIYGTYTDSSNYERLTLSTTAGSSVNIVAETLGTGGDNLDIVLTPAGTGNVKFGTHSAIAAETVTGYITIKDAGGTSRKIAVVS